MRERLLTLVLALGAFALFYVMLIPKPQPQGAGPSEPLTTDVGPDGANVVWRWLQVEHIPVTSLRYRYDQLQHSTGNLLVTEMPHRLDARKDEWPALTHWIESGNTLLVLAALDDTPAWTLGIEPDFVVQLKRLTDLTFDVVKAQKSDDRQPTDERAGDAFKALFDRPDVLLEPRGEHPLTSGVHTIHASTEFAASRWIATPAGSTTPLAMLQRSDEHEPALWVMRRGSGQVIVLAFATPFSNSEIAKGDNAQLLSNIIAWSRTATGRVIFDDAHQGLTNYYDELAFFGDPRLHRTLAWLVLLWLVFVLGPLPLRRAFGSWKPVDETALIEATGRFYSASVLPLAAAHRMFENFFNRLRQRLSLPQNGEPLWEWLDSQSSVSREQNALLRRQYSQVYAGESVRLSKLQNLLTDIQGKVA